MAGTNGRTPEQVRLDIEAERERLADAVDDLRGEMDVNAKLRPKLPLAAAAALGAGFVVSGGIGATMIPEWSLPSSTSSSARIIPSESSPRTLRCSSCSPPGSRAPGSATATVAPAPKFQAPQTICLASPSPTSTRQSCSRSAFGCLTASSTRPTRKRPRLPSSSGTPRRSIPSTSAVEIESRSASSGSGISSGTYSRSHETGTLKTGSGP